MTTELTVCQRCGKVRLPVPPPGYLGNPALATATEKNLYFEWRTPPPCFRPKPGLIVNNSECPECERKRIRNN